MECLKRHNFHSDVQIKRSLGDIDQGTRSLGFLSDTSSLQTRTMFDNYRKLRGDNIESDVFVRNIFCLSYEELLAISERLKHHLFTRTCEHVCQLVKLIIQKLVDFLLRYFIFENDKNS